MHFRVFPVVAVVAVSVFSVAAQQASEASLTPSQQLLRQFGADKNSVAHAAVVAHLRNDINSYAKPGKRTELALDADAAFNDGTVLKKGTILGGEVVEAAAPGKDKGISRLVLDWTEAELPKKQKETVAVIVRDAEGGQPYQQTDRSFGRNQLGATSSSGSAGDKLSTEMNLILMNQKEGMPQVAPGVQMIKQDRHSLSVASQDDDVVIHELTKFVVVIFKAKEQSK